MSDSGFTIFYWAPFDEIILVPIRVVADFDIDEFNEIDPEYFPRLSLSNCVYIGEL